MQGPSLGTAIQLGPPRHSQEQVPEDIRDILKPTSERYMGPIDLDEVVAQRVKDINRTWLASIGKLATCVLRFTLLRATRAPVVMKSFLRKT